MFSVDFAYWRPSRSGVHQINILMVGTSDASAYAVKHQTSNRIFLIRCVSVMLNRKGQHPGSTARGTATTIW